MPLLTLYFYVLVTAAVVSLALAAVSLSCRGWLLGLAAWTLALAGMLGLASIGAILLLGALACAAGCWYHIARNR